MGNREKRIDLKYYIDDEIKHWYNEKITTFYFVITKDGEILFFSEDSLDFFRLKSIYDIEELNIDKYIGKVNWNILQNKLEEIDQNDEYFQLDEKIQDKYKLSAIWKNFVEMEENRYIIVFKINKQSDVEEYEEVEKVEDNNTLYKDFLDKISLPIAITKDQTLFYKNNFFNNYLNDNKELLNIFNEVNKPYPKELSLPNKTLKIKYDELIDNYKSIIFYEKDIEIQKNDFKTTEELNNLIEIKDNLIKLLKDTLSNMKEQLFNIIKSEINVDVKKDGTKTIDLKYYFNKFEKIIIDTTSYLTKMSEIADFIENISVKIHLISINAAIESARSGELGKGFAVISREIAKLSDATKNHTKMINKQIKDIKQFYSEQNIETDFKNTQIISYIETLTDSKEKINEIKKNVKNDVIDKIDAILNSIT